MIHERTLELITSVQKRVFSSLKPSKLVELFRLGEGAPPALGITTAEVVDGMYGFLGFTRLLSASVLRKTIAEGVKDGHFAYYSGPKPTLGPDGRYQVALNKLRTPPSVIPEDEIDLESGFLMLPQAIPQPVPPPDLGPSPPGTGPGTGVVPAGTGPGPLPPGRGPEPGPGPTPPPKPALQTAVDLSFAADRNQLFTAWNAVGNLADLAGKVKVTIHAESPTGFDKSKLNNGVLEPLREADLID
jgi:hypothetical protein